MSDKGIIFSSPMVRALLAGTKTQTRRLLKNQPPEWATFCQQPDMLNALHQWVPSGLWRWSEAEQSPLRALREWPVDEQGEHYWLRPPFRIGDRLWVRETWAVASIYDGKKPREINPEGIPLYCGIRYAATDERRGIKDRSCRFMPRWASRLWLEVTDVRVQRLQDIPEADILAEGAPLCDQHRDHTQDGSNPHMCVIKEGEPWATQSPRAWYHRLWDNIRTAKGERWDDNPWIVAVTFKVHRENIDKPEPRCPHGEPLKGGWCAGCVEECEEAA